jgi:hypothetical protein
MSLKRFVLAILLAGSGMGIQQIHAQCKSFTKRKCLPHLAPYMNNGQLNTATMSPGQTAA